MTGNQISIWDIEEQKALTWAEFNQIEPHLRKARWDEFKQFFPEHAEDYEDVSACYECECRHAQDGWCDYTDFPCGYNPYFTLRTGLGGMACMGMVPRDE